MVDGHTISRMQHATKSIWKTIDSSTPMGSPWTSVSAAHQQEFYRLMEAKYPFLHFCKCHYKADAIAHEDYSHWYSRKEGEKSGSVSKARLQKCTHSKTEAVDPPIPSKCGSRTPSTPPTSHTTQGPCTLESTTQISGTSQSSPVPAQRNPSTTAHQQTPSPTHLPPENTRAPNIHDDAITTPSITVGVLSKPHGVSSDTVLTESHTLVITVCVFSSIVLHINSNIDITRPFQTPCACLYLYRFKLIMY